MSIFGDLPANLALGLSVAFSVHNLLLCFLGVVLGMIVGVMPGVGAIAAISLLLPVTYYLEPAGALIMLAGVYYGGTYGGSTASILLNLPGTPSSAVACLDGYPMAQKGRAGVALFMTTIASFAGASVGIGMLILFAPVIVNFALRFGAVEYFSIIILGLLAASAVSSGSTLKAVTVAVLGIAFGTVGTDVYTGVARLTFGQFALFDGISLVALALGVFGIAEVISSVKVAGEHHGNTGRVTLRSMVPSRDDLRRSWPAILRGTGVGSFFGTLPGTGATISSFAAYAIERRLSKESERFGQGAIEGVAAPEAANNASDQTAFIPTLTLGIPGTPTMAIMLGALMIHGITPGPGLMSGHPDVFWGLIMSFWVGNLMLLVLAIPLIGIWVRALTIPYHLLFPGVIMFVCVGTYCVNLSSFDVWIVFGFGALGYISRILDYPAAPMLLGFILGPMLEEQFRRAMLLSGGDVSVFVTSPISAGFLAATVVILVVEWVSKTRRVYRTPAMTNDE